jgi:FlaA1/EpsC-like NDP-sugar epimerase
MTSCTERPPSSGWLGIQRARIERIRPWAERASFQPHFQLAVQALLLSAAYWTAFQLRFDFQLPVKEWRTFWATLPLLLVLRLAAYTHLGFFRGFWRHFCLEDLVNLVKAVTLSSLCFTAVLMLWDQSDAVPRSVLLLDWAAAIFASGGLPFLARAVHETSRTAPKASGRRALVIGAGEKAERLLRELHREQEATLQVLGLVDDQGRRGRAIHRVPVIGALEDLAELLPRLRIELVVIALDQPAAGQIEWIVSQCTQAKVEFKTLPSLPELLQGTARADQLRSVRIEDLLGREPISLDLAAVAEDVAGRVVLVTGAAGSIGSELARQIAAFGPARLVLVDQAESDLYFIQLELGARHPALDLHAVICDITQGDRLEDVFATHRPHYVIHAAAYKHVPLMEANVAEAVRNNVFGTLAVADGAARWGAHKFLLISTDKAVNPSSVMGATKRIAERIIFGLPRLRSAATSFRAVRFGNVLASQGSVVPLFERQLAQGGPLTVTHPEVERYFMTIPEAVQLVLFSAALPETEGTVAMLDMGRPVRILDLAEKLIRLSGLVPHRDVPVVFTGLRPGEKLLEELCYAFEAARPTTTDKVRVLDCPAPASAALESGLRELLAALEGAGVDELLAAMCGLVPECVAPLSERQSAASRYRKSPALGISAVLGRLEQVDLPPARGVVQTA